MNRNYWQFILPIGLSSVSILCFIPVDSKTLKEEKRNELFESLKANESIGWEVDVINPRELSAKMLKKLVCDFQFPVI